MSKTPEEIENIREEMGILQTKLEILEMALILELGDTHKVGLAVERAAREYYKTETKAIPKKK